MDDIVKAVEVFNKKGCKAICVDNAAPALKHVLNVISADDTVGMGGSVTLDQIGIVKALLERGNTIYSSAVARKLGNDPDEARLLAMGADVFLSSSNAVTLEGDLINIDAIGNRVAGMFYGPKKVVIVAGRNKITTNPHTAVLRIKKFASPQNTKRLGLDTPCAKTGKCTDCDSPQRICNVVTRIQYPPWGKEIHVVLIDEDYGF